MPTPADHLELARTESDGAALCRMADTPYPFVRHALAANPHCPPAALLKLSATRDCVWNDNMLLRLLAGHPRADRTVLRAVLAATARQLADGERPYAAVLALAERPELTVEEVAALGTLHGASARLRGRLTRQLGRRRAHAGTTSADEPIAR